MANLALVEPRPTPPPVAPEPPPLPAKAEKSKLRSAWISFASRILAQLIGAAATIGLGVVVMTNYSAPNAPIAAAAPAKPADVRRAGAAPAVIPNQEPVIAVLPLLNLSGDPRFDAFAGALTESLIAELAASRRMQVISRTSTLAHKTVTKALPAIASDLGASLVVEGSVIADKKRVRVIAQLIDGATDRHLWARTFDREGADFLALEAELASAVAREVEQAVAQRRPQ